MKRYFFLLGSILLLSQNVFASELSNASEDSYRFECDFIYWYVAQEGNTYASTGVYVKQPAPIVDLTTGGEVYAPEPKMEPGFKLALGLDLCQDDWGLLCRYTWIAASQSSLVTSTDMFSGIVPLFVYDLGGNGAMSFATFETPGNTTYVSKSTANWRNHLNSLDAELAKSVYNSRLFSLRSFLGLKGSWQKEKLRLLYELDTNAAGLSKGNNRVETDQSFWGVGPRLGFDVKWGVPGLIFGLFSPHGSEKKNKIAQDDTVSFDLTFDASASALYSRFVVDARSYDTLAANYTSILIGDQRFVLKKLTPVFESMIGVEVNKLFENCSRLKLSAGWENQIWLFMNQHSSSIADISLSYSGLTAKAVYNY